MHMIFITVQRVCVIRFECGRLSSCTCTSKSPLPSGTHPQISTHLVVLYNKQSVREVRKQKGIDGKRDGQEDSENERGE